MRKINGILSAGLMKGIILCSLALYGCGNFKELTGDGDDYDIDYTLGDSVFNVKITSPSHDFPITFVVDYTIRDGANFSSFILFGDGDEESVTQWSTTDFSEEVSHTYKRSGSYTAVLVLVPRELIPESGILIGKKVGDFKGIRVVRKIQFTLA